MEFEYPSQDPTPEPDYTQPSMDDEAVDITNDLIDLMLGGTPDQEVEFLGQVAAEYPSQGVELANTIIAARKLRDLYLSEVPMLEGTPLTEDEAAAMRRRFQKMAGLPIDPPDDTTKPS